MSNGKRSRDRAFKSSSRSGSDAKRTRVTATNDEKDSKVTAFEPLEETVVQALRRRVSAWLVDRHGEAESGSDRNLIARLYHRVERGQLDLPRFPDVPMALDRLLRSPEPNPRQVIETVQRDPDLVRQIWASAASARFSKPPLGLPDAITRVGLSTVWRLGVKHAFDAVLFDVPAYARQVEAVREHGEVTAELTALAAREARGPAYLAGLLHDVGKLLIYRDCAPSRSFSCPSPPAVELMVRHLHGPLGLLATHWWGLGAAVSVGVGFHHDLGEAPLTHQRLARLVFLADEAAHVPEQSEQDQEASIRRIEGAAPAGIDVPVLIATALRLCPDTEDAAPEGV
jgi:HD-like signal output (HDOD) protein